MEQKEDIALKEEKAMTMGRPKTFDGPTTKLSVVVPTETARAMQVMAA